MSGNFSMNVTISEYNPEWPRLFEAEEKEIRRNLETLKLIDIQHFGSTAVPGLAAKPIVDIMVGFQEFSEAHRALERLSDIGYTYMEEVSVPGGRLFLWKYPSVKYHLHLTEYGTEHWMKPLLFRDYLRQNPKARQEYETLKRSLAEKFQHDRFAYTRAKTEFIGESVAKAN